LKTIAVIAALFAAVPLSPAPADAPATDSRVRLVCRGGEKVVGSHMRAPRRCRSEEEWARIDEEAGRLPVSLRVNAAQNDGTQQRPQP
jgi:hypothetical protein